MQPYRYSHYRCNFPCTPNECSVHFTPSLRRISLGCIIEPPYYSISLLYKTKLCPLMMISSPGFNSFLRREPGPYQVFSDESSTLIHLPSEMGGVVLISTQLKLKTIKT